MSLRNKISSGLVLAILGGCAGSPELEETFGAFYDPSRPYSFEGQRVKVLYSTGINLKGLRISSKDKFLWPAPGDSELIEEVTKKLIFGGAYISLFPVFEEDKDLSFRLAQYVKDWDSLMITDWNFDPKLVNKENLGRVYLASYDGKKVNFGKFSNSSKNLVEGNKDDLNVRKGVRFRLPKRDGNLY